MLGSITVPHLATHRESKSKVRQHTINITRSGRGAQISLENKISYTKPLNRTDRENL